jgi:hypothetical protein
MAIQSEFLRLKPELILLTQKKLRERILKRFPTSGLGEVAQTLVEVAAQATVRAEKIRRPNVPLRILLILVLLALVIFGPALFFSAEVRGLIAEKNILELAERILRVVVYLIAAMIFLYSLERRLKRWRALAALHELRALAHVIDMHQVAKEPEGLVRLDPKSPAAASYTTKSLYDLNRYLNYCNEMLAIISKVAALYVQDFPDPQTVTVVDQVESLCSGLSERIWQKLMIMDQFREPSPDQEKARLLPSDMTNL